MINDERIDEAKRNVKQYVDDGLLKINDKDSARFVGFFMANANLPCEQLLFYSKYQMMLHSKKY